MNLNKILNFGSLNLDIVYSLEHIVRPGETVPSDEINTFCGGKGLNQSVAVARSGNNIYHAGKIGEDGKILKDVLLETGINCDYLMETKGRSGNALIQKDSHGENCIILYGGANREISKEEIDNVLKNFTEGDILISQNEISNVPYLLNVSKKKGMKIVFNPSPMEDWIKTYPLNEITWLIINEVEGEVLTGYNDPDSIISQLLLKYPDICIVLTLGKDGVICADKNAQYINGVYAKKVVDSTAAGDTFLGYFIGAILKGKQISDALKEASIASAIAVSQKGAVPSIPTIEMVRDFEKHL